MTIVFILLVYLVVDVKDRIHQNKWEITWSPISSANRSALSHVQCLDETSVITSSETTECGERVRLVSHMCMSDWHGHGVKMRQCHRSLGRPGNSGDVVEQLELVRLLFGA